MIMTLELTRLVLLHRQISLYCVFINDDLFSTFLFRTFGPKKIITPMNCLDCFQMQRCLNSMLDMLSPSRL